MRGVTCDPFTATLHTPFTGRARGAYCAPSDVPAINALDYCENVQKNCRQTRPSKLQVQAWIPAYTRLPYFLKGIPGIIPRAMRDGKRYVEKGETDTLTI